MNCAYSLLRDHDDIACMMRVLAATVDRLRQGAYVDPDMLAGLDGFLRRFIVDCHFRKEDTIVFPHVRAILPDEIDRTLTCTALHADCVAALEACHTVLARVRHRAMDATTGELAAAVTRCVDRSMVHIASERPLLERLRCQPP